MRAETSEVISLPGVAQTRAMRVAVPGPPPAPRSRFDSTAWPAVTRAAQIAATLERAPADARFGELVGEADAARDRGDWGHAERLYAAALALHPLHWGYCIQHAHMIKEQGHYLRAEAWYLSAVALGAPAVMVDQHLAYVARHNGSDYARAGDPQLDVPPLLAPPTLHDLHVLGELTRVRGLGDDMRVLDLLRTCADNRAVLLQMIARPEFARTNRAFLDLLRG